MPPETAQQTVPPSVSSPCGAEQLAFLLPARPSQSSAPGSPSHPHKTSEGRGTPPVLPQSHVMGYSECWRRAQEGWVCYCQLIMPRVIYLRDTGSVEEGRDTGKDLFPSSTGRDRHSSSAAFTLWFEGETGMDPSSSSAEVSQICHPYLQLLQHLLTLTLCFPSATFLAL